MALEALGLIGHEMSGSANAVTSLAVYALQSLAREKRGMESVSLQRLEGWTKRLEMAADDLDAHVLLGYLIGRRSDGHLMGFRSEQRIGDIAFAALALVRREMNRGLIRIPDRGVILRDDSTPQWATKLKVDRPLLTSAVLNLLRNAVKYSTPDQGRGPCTVRIDISLEPEDGPRFAVISVESFGVPIDPTLGDSIFLPFVRGIGELNFPVNFRGMGLGLYIVRAVARGHLGSVSLATPVAASFDPKGNARQRIVFRLSVPLGLPAGEYNEVVD